ncbi:hypothetical protein B0H14DRAFT_3454197 [Mycena olivaceomarginata]|nr:hypothetical protein B0H14DRAFT_3454197 [Mycena olivaceomarginata]
MATLCAIVFVAAAMLHVQDPGSLPQNVKISVYYIYLYSQGVAHRDIKPENLFFDTMGHLKLYSPSPALSPHALRCTFLRLLPPCSPPPSPCLLMSLLVHSHPFPPPAIPVPVPFPSLYLFPSPIGNYGASTVYRLPWEATIHMSTGPYGSEPYIAPEQFLGKPYDERLVDIWTCGIVCYCLHTATRKTASGLLPTLTVRKCAAPTPDLRQHLLAYQEPDCTDPLTCNNTSWHLGSRTAPTPVARAVSPDLVDSDNTSSKIGCSVPTPVACTVSPDLVDSNNTSWKIVGSVPTAVACTVSPDLVDSDNTSWKILRTPVVQARAENLGDCGQYFLDHQVDEGNTNWTIGNNRRFLLLLELLPTFEWCPPAPSVAAFRSDSVPSLLTGSTML